MPSAQLAMFSDDPPGDFVDSLRSFDYGGRKTLETERHSVPFFVNEFWTSKQRAAHSIHEISYRACFKPQLPEFFISRLTKEGDTVYDPFGGRGTTAVQAALMGRRPVSNDINPLSATLARPRTNPPSAKEVEVRLRQIAWGRATETRDDLLVFYHPETLREITSLREYLIGRDADGLLDPIDDWIRAVAINRLTGHSPGFFSVYSLPPNQAVSISAQAKINEKRLQVPPRRVVPDIINKKTRTLLKDGSMMPHPMGHFTTRPAADVPEIARASVQLVVTSPPFLDVVQYAADNWLRCWFAGFDSSAINIAMFKKPDEWTAFISRTFSELARVVAPAGHVAFEVGEVRGGKLDLEELVLRAISAFDFDVLGVMVNDQVFTKTANAWGVSNGSKGTNTNRIVLARRK